MRRWLLFLGGPLAWALHFGLVYAINSVSVQAAGDTVLLARFAIVGAGMVGVAICALLLWFAARMPAEDALDQFWGLVATAGATVGGVAIIWQSTPALLPI